MQTRPFIHNGYDRPYLIYRPAHLAKNPAVVFMLGGIGSTAKFASQNFGWTQEADRNGFIVVFPEPVATDPSKPENKKNNITFWQMKGSRTRMLASNAIPVDDDGYLIGVLRDVLHRDHPDRKRVFFAGFSSGSGMVQLLASRHPKDIRAIVAVATPLMDPPPKLARPVGVLYIHGDDDEQFSGFETLSPHFATTSHGNWVTWGYLDGCQKQTAENTAWGVRFSWQRCKNDVPVIADFIAGLGHEWAGSLDSTWDQLQQTHHPLNFTDMAWHFFASMRTK
ncbi:MAG: alpha/beta fold hydrolase [Acidobacteriaceae bacterium]